MRVSLKLLALGMAASAASPALAHTGGDLSIGSGLLHPVLGVDHLLAMLGVGMLAASRPILQGALIVGAFVASVMAASLLGMAGISLGLAEPGILVSLMVFGGLIAAGDRLPVWAVCLATGVFGLAHGFAHGVEAVGASSAYLAAFLFSSLVLHGAGFLTGVGMQRWTHGRLAAGLAIGMSGLALSLA